MMPTIKRFLIAVLVSAHVLLVWAYRYEWQWTQATRNGYAGFVIFHVALLLILASTLAPARASVPR